MGNKMPRTGRGSAAADRPREAALPLPYYYEYERYGHYRYAGALGVHAAMLQAQQKAREGVCRGLSAGEGLLDLLDVLAAVLVARGVEDGFMGQPLHKQVCGRRPIAVFAAAAAASAMVARARPGVTSSSGSIASLTPSSSMLAPETRLSRFQRSAIVAARMSQTARWPRAVAAVQPPPSGRARSVSLSLPTSARSSTRLSEFAASVSGMPAMTRS